jgi:hypothetical protein
MEAMEGIKAMEHSMDWETDLDRALERATSEGRPVLLDFFNPE